jgi:hypothetical protein
MLKINQLLKKLAAFTPLQKPSGLSFGQKSLLLLLQESAISSHPKPDESNPHPTTLLF